jgi:hypothetical protein
MNKRWKHFRSIVDTPADLRALYEHAKEMHKKAVEEGQLTADSEMTWRIRRAVLGTMLTQSMMPETEFPPRWKDADTSTKEELESLTTQRARQYGNIKKTQERRYDLHQYLLGAFNEVPRRLPECAENGEIDKAELAERYDVSVKTIEKDLTYLRTEVE